MRSLTKEKKIFLLISNFSNFRHFLNIKERERANNKSSKRKHKKQQREKFSNQMKKQENFVHFLMSLWNCVKFSTHHPALFYSSFWCWKFRVSWESERCLERERKLDFSNWIICILVLSHPQRFHFPGRGGKCMYVCVK